MGRGVTSLGEKDRFASRRFKVAAIEEKNFVRLTKKICLFVKMVKVVTKEKAWK